MLKQPPPQPHKRSLLLPWVIAIAMFMETLDSTIVGVAIPHIAESFQINPVNMKLALTSYLLSLAVFIPISGWLADKYREKRIFLLAILIFTLSSLACGLSPNLPCLIIARLIQGFGGALMMPVGRLIVLRAYPKEEFSKAMGKVIIPALVGPALGPTLGGFILKFLTWHWIFLVNIPFGVIGFIAGYYLLSSEKKAIGIPPFNWLGFFFFSTGLALITIAMAILGEDFRFLYAAISMGFMAILMLVIYVKLSKKQPHPLLDMNLFKDKTFSVAMSVSLISRIGIGAVPFLFPMLLQIVWGKSALYSGTVFIFMAFGMMATRLLLNQRLLLYFGYKRWLFIINTLLTLLLINLCWFATPQPLIYLYVMIFSIGVLSSQLYLSINTLYPKVLPPSAYSQGTSIASTIQQFSSGLGIASAAIMLHLVAAILHQPVFSSQVFYWTFIWLNIIGGFSLLCIIPLDKNL
jgi:EmrB/QacA subfamily drug resistance transporter